MSFYNGYVLYVIVTLVICIAVGREITDERLKEDSSNLISKEEVLQEKVKHSLVRRDTAVGSTETPIDDPKTIVTQEGFRDDVRTIKTKVKDKVNSTITSTKDKVKQKVKDKVQKKIEEKLDPTGGYLKLPAIIGIAVAVVVLLLISCIVCCCCCPYCILYKRRQTRNEKYEPAEVHLQPLRKTDDYNLVTSQDYNNENGAENA
ncbi:UNVERIFIED_CONTAM: hypothetical protein RMT77_009186 [Armadillidium vulgare]